MELHPSVLSFFHDAVTESMQSLHVEATEPTEFYLVNLLVEFTKPTPLAEEPVALKLAQVQSASPEEKFKGLKDIGDTTLYVSGFFADSLNRKLVDISYYMTVGESAYRQLSGMLGGTRGAATGFFREAYTELAAKFATFVGVLQEIRRNTSFSGGGNLVRVYEEWVRTGSEVLEKRLRESGLFAVETFDRSKKSVH